MTALATQQPTTKRPRTRKAPLTLAQRVEALLAERQILRAPDGALLIAAADGHGYHKATPTTCTCKAFGRDGATCKHVALVCQLAAWLNPPPAVICRDCGQPDAHPRTAQCETCMRADLFGDESEAA